MIRCGSSLVLQGHGNAQYALGLRFEEAVDAARTTGEGSAPGGGGGGDGCGDVSGSSSSSTCGGAAAAARAAVLFRDAATGGHVRAQYHFAYVLDEGRCGNIVQAAWASATW